MNRLIVLFAFALFCADQAQAQLDQTPWHLEVEWEIGDEESDIFLSYPHDLAIGFDNQIYLSDRREPKILVFNKSGEETMTIGREGQGPGEFTEVTSMLAMPEGGILVNDRRNGRLTQFGSDGALVRSISISSVGDRLYFVAAYDAATDRVALTKDMTRGATDEPLLYWVDLTEQELGEGVLKPSELVDLEDPVYAFSAMRMYSYGVKAFDGGDGVSEIVLFPLYYTGAWSLTRFTNGILQAPDVHFPSEDHAVKHATILDISEDEWRASNGKYGNALGSYSQEGINFADIHNFAKAGIQVGLDNIGIAFHSEESGMDGYWVDVFTKEGVLVGRHPITHNLNSITETGVSLFASNGLGEVYFLYYTPDMVPIIGRGRLVPQD